MASKIEDMIEEIQDYIDGCKYQMFNSTMILVNKEEIDELLRQLRIKTPEEIKRYRQMVSNKEAIMRDANEKANEIVSRAQVYMDNKVNEHEIMQEAYTQANAVIMQASEKAQDVLDEAMNEANNIRISAMTYTDDQLGSIQSILTTALETNQARHDALVTNLQQILSVVNANRAQLHPEEDNEFAERAEADRAAAKQSQGANADML